MAAVSLARASLELVPASFSYELVCHVAACVWVSMFAIWKKKERKHTTQGRDGIWYLSNCLFIYLFTTAVIRDLGRKFSGGAAHSAQRHRRRVGVAAATRVVR